MTSPISRTRLPGVDILTLNTAPAIRAAHASGDLAPLTEVAPLSSFPWLFRYFFPLTRLYRPASSTWFLPFRPRASPTYAPNRAFIDDAFAAPPPDHSPLVAAAADILLRPRTPPSDLALNDILSKAIWAYFGDPALVPGEVFAALHDHVKSLPEAFNPCQALFAQRNTARVFDFAEAHLAASGDLQSSACPGELVTDVAHTFFATNLNGATILRALADDVEAEPSQVLTAVGPTENVVRFAKRDTTLGGLLEKGQEAIKGFTIVQLNLRAAAKETGDMDYVFGNGTGMRACAAGGVILRFYMDVQNELRRRKP